MRFLQTLNLAHRGLSYDKKSGEVGTTFVELLVVLAIMSLLAMVSIPYAEKAVQRHNEIELRRVLRETRSAIDAFHQDWKRRAFPQGNDEASENGYPVSLEVLVNGVEVGDASGKLLRYMRTLPRNPFVGGDIPFDAQWRLFGYQDRPDVADWDGKDVYDLRANTERVALDGSKIFDW